MHACQVLPTVRLFHTLHKEARQRILARAVVERPQPQQFKSIPAGPKPHPFYQKLGRADAACECCRPQRISWWPGRIEVGDIVRVVADEFNVTPNDIKHGRRTQRLVEPRQVSMYLAKTISKRDGTYRSLPEIGKKIGGKDHTTVLHAVWRITERMETELDLAGRVQRCKEQILAWSSGK